LQNVVGVHAIAFAARHKFMDFAELEKAVLKESKAILKKGDSFALRARRSAGELSSKDYENKLGKAIMDTIPGLSVNLSNPDKTIFIEVRKKDFFLYSSQIDCLRGLPLGVEGNIAFLFEGKKKELLAAFLLMYRGCNIFPIVKKKSKAIETHVAKLAPFNAYRRCILTEQKDIDALIKERDLQAIGTADESLENLPKTDSHGLVVLRPLLLYPKELIREKEKLFR